MVTAHIDNYFMKSESEGEKRDRVVGGAKCREGFLKRWLLDFLIIEGSVIWTNSPAEYK